MSNTLFIVIKMINVGFKLINKENNVYTYILYTSCLEIKDPYVPLGHDTLINTHNEVTRVDYIDNTLHIF